MKRQIALFLTLALTSSLLACAGDSGSTETTTAASTDTTTEAPETTLDSVPALDFEGATVTFFSRTENASMPEFYVEEQTGDIVDDAIFNRNQAVEERLNVNFEYVENESNNATRFEWSDLLSQSVLAGDGAYDIAAGYSMCLASLASKGHLVDLRSTQYLDFSKPWWSDSLLAESVVNDKLYFASGDISTWMTLYTYAMLFNKNILADYKLEDPYTLVDEGKWTIDKLSELTKDVYRDLNGDDKKDMDDQYGFWSALTYTDVLFFASGQRTTTVEDGEVKISPTFSSEKTHELLTKICSMFYETNDSYLSGYNENYYFNFGLGKSLFSTLEISSVYTDLRDVTFDYGILPIPKYDEAQENYYTVASFPYTLYGIPLDAKNPDMASAVMECLASESSRTVVPALFEVALKVKYSQDDNDARMYDIIRESVVFDLGRVFVDSLDSMTYSIFRDSVGANRTDWGSTCASKLPALESKMAALFSEIGS